MKGAFLSLWVFVWLGGVAGAAVLDPALYVGSERCRGCHPEKYQGWSKTFHATVVQDAKKNPEAVLGDFSVPNLGFTLEDVEFTIGGHWQQRYMKKIGDDYYVLPKLWSVQSQKWQAYNVWSWRKMPYGKYCKGCHVTGFDPTRGKAVEPRIGCEACHGPGRAHAEAEGAGLIVNPKKLSDERRDMICAACHVRGTDPSKTYYFPVGFMPGDDLGEHYVPNGKEPEETNTQAVLRMFAKWKKKREEGAQLKCDVCGIPGVAEERDQEKVDSMLEFCFGCHGFKNKYAEHTRHPAGVGLMCFDCHVQQTKEIMNPGTKDIHSYGYFLVHKEKCYDPQIEKACGKCHGDKGPEWARRTVESWGKPVELDH
ncbi:multiheme c-type cytochrome [Deferrisoma palaeochoriense]